MPKATKVMAVIALPISKTHLGGLSWTLYDEEEKVQLPSFIDNFLLLFSVGHPYLLEIEGRDMKETKIWEVNLAFVEESQSWI